MLAIEAIGSQLRRLPGVVRLGIGVMAFGGFADVVMHLGVEGTAGAAVGGAGEHAAHLIGFAGMVLVQAGVVLDGVRRSRARRSAGDSRKGVA